MNRLLSVTLLGLVLSGCGGTEGGSETEVSVTDLSQNQSSRIATSSIDPGTNGCEAGGVKIDMGFDQNDNLVLDESEITDSQIVCHGIDGEDSATSETQDGEDGLTSLIKIYDEPVGVNCSYGGKKLTTGLDENSDGLLSTSEILKTDYLCLPQPVVPNDGEDGSSCSVTDNFNGSATINCEDGTSVTITDGQDGVDGEDGSDGEDGIDGINGGTAKLKSSLYCSTALSGGVNVVYQYKLHLFENGLIEAIGTIISSYVQASTHEYYTPGDSNYSKAPVTLALDVFQSRDGNSIGVWNMSLNSSPVGTKITYTDNDYVTQCYSAGQSNCSSKKVKSWSANSSHCSSITY